GGLATTERAAMRFAAPAPATFSKNFLRDWGRLCSKFIWNLNCAVRVEDIGRHHNDPARFHWSSAPSHHHRDLQNGSSIHTAARAYHRPGPDIPGHTRHCAFPPDRVPGRTTHRYRSR